MTAKRAKIRIDENSLWAKPIARKEWDILSHAMDESENYNCYEKPELYSDYPENITQDEAEVLCYRCPLLKKCYDFAIASEVAWGVWGGVNFTDTTQLEE